MYYNIFEIRNEKDFLMRSLVVQFYNLSKTEELFIGI